MTTYLTHNLGKGDVESKIYENIDHQFTPAMEEGLIRWLDEL